MDIAQYSFEKTVVECEDKMLQVQEMLRIMIGMNAIARFECANPGGVLDLENSIASQAPGIKRVPLECFIVRASKIMRACSQGNYDMIQAINNVTSRAIIGQNTTPIFIRA